MNDDEVKQWLDKDDAEFFAFCAGREPGGTHTAYVNACRKLAETRKRTADLEPLFMRMLAVVSSPHLFTSESVRGLRTEAEKALGDLTKASRPSG